LKSWFVTVTRESRYYVKAVDMDAATDLVLDGEVEPAGEETKGTTCVETIPFCDNCGAFIEEHRRHRSDLCLSCTLTDRTDLGDEQERRFCCGADNVK
jgi:hypothetical protein